MLILNPYIIQQLAAAGYTLAYTTNGQRYPTDAPYNATPNTNVPGSPANKNIMFFFTGVSDRGPVDYSGSSPVLAEIESQKIVPLAGERTDGWYLSVHECTGGESGTLHAVYTDGPHDWLSIGVLIAHPTFDLTVIRHASLSGRLGSITGGNAAAMTGPSILTDSSDQFVLFAGGIASTGATSGTPTHVTSVTPPSLTAEIGRVVDEVLEIMTFCGGQVVTPGTNTYSASCINPLTDDLFGCGFAVVIGPRITVTGAAADANAGDAATGSYSATGGTGSKTYSVIGTAPFTVSSAGARSGNYGSAGTYTYQIKSVDANGNPGFLNEVVVVGGGASPATWNPSDKTAQATLSNSNKTFTSTSSSTSAFGAARSTNKLTGKRRFQATINGSTGTAFSISVGFADITVPMNSVFDPGGVNKTCGFYPGAGGNAARVYQDTSRQWPSDATLNALTATSYTMDFLYDEATRKYWIGVAGTGAYFGGGNPVTGTTPTGTMTGTGDVYACCGDDQGTTIPTKTVVMTGDPSGYTGSPVSGFTDGF